MFLDEADWIQSFPSWGGCRWSRKAVEDLIPTLLGRG